MDRLWGPALAATLALAACSGGGDGRDAASAPVTGRVDGPASTSTTTAASSTTTTTVAAEPPPFSFDGSVPPPPLVNTGTDYEAIYRSLDAYGEWLFAHEPTAQGLAEIIVEDTALWDTNVREIAILREDNLRLHNPGRSVTSVEVVDVGEAVVSLKVVNKLGEIRIVDETNAIIDAARLPPSETLAVLLSRDSRGRWRLASIVSTSDAEVAL